MYLAGSAEKNKDTLANIASMIVFNAVEDWVATMMDAHYSVNPPLKVQSKRGTSDERTMQRITKVLWNNAQETHIEENSEQGFRSGVKYGTLVFKTPYQIEEDLGWEIIKQPKEINIFGIKLKSSLITETKAVEKIHLEDRVPLVPLDIRNLYFRYDKRSWVIEKIQTTWDIIEKQAENGAYENIEKAKTTTPDATSITDTIKEQIGSTPSNSVKSLDGDLELLEGHQIPIKFEAEDGVPELTGKKVLCRISLVNRQEVIGIVPQQTKFNPYIFCPFIPHEFSELGIGIPQIIETLVKEYNTRRNQSLDANTFGLYSMVVANMKYIKKPEQLKIRPNGVIELKGVPAGVRAEDVIAFIRPPTEFVQIAASLMDRINAEIVTTTRLKGVMSGEKISPNPSATEMTSIMKEALKSIKLIFRRIDRNVFEEYYQRVYTYFVLNRQKSWIIATTEQRINPETGAPMEVPMWEEITPEQIYTDGIDIKILGTTHMQDEIILRHQNMQLLDIAAKYQGLPIKDDLGQPVMPNFYNLMNDVYYTFGKDDVTRLWTTPPPPPEPKEPKEEKPDLPKVNFSFKGEDLTSPAVMDILIQNGIVKPPQGPGMMRGTPLQGQNYGTPLQGTGIPPAMQGGPGAMGLGTPPPTTADLVGGATNPRAIRKPIRGIK